MEAVVGADITAFRRGMRSVRDEVGFLSETMSGIASVGRGLTLAVTTPLVTLGTFAVQAASDFDAAMRNINAIAQLGETQFQDLSNAVLDFGKRTRSGPVGAANAMYTAFSAGIDDVATAMQFMEIASKTAEAGLADIEITTEALVGSFLAFGGAGLPVAEQMEMVTRHADALTQMVAIGVGPMEAFAGALGNVLPSASSIGASIEDLYGTVAYLTQRSLSASEATVSLNAALGSMLKPSKAMKAAFAELGVSSGEELVASLGGLEEAFVALIGTADGSLTELNAMFQSRQAQRAASLIANNVEQWQTALSDFEASLEGTVNRAHEQQMKSFAAQFDLMTSALNGLAITVGQKLFPVIEPIMGHIATLANHLSDLNPEIVAVATAFLGLTAAVGPVLWLLSSMITPIGFLIGALGGLGTAFVTNVGGFRETVEEGVGGLLEGVEGTETFVDGLLKILFPENYQETINNELALNKVSVGTEDVITIEAGDTLWDLWAETYRDTFTWEEFKTAVGWKQGMVLHPGDIITVPTTFKEDTLALFDGQGFSLDELWNRLLMAGNRMKMEQWQQIPRELWYNFDGSRELSNPIATSLQDRLTEAVTYVKNNLGPILTPLVTNITSWFDTQAGAGLEGVARLFETEGEEGGNTPVYNAVAAVLKGDMAAAIDAIVPGLGTNVKTAIEGWSDDIGAAFPKIQASLSQLTTNMGNWLLEEGIPTLARASGNLAGRLAVSLYDAITGVVAFFQSGDASQAAGEIADYWNSNVSPEIQAGFNEAVAGTKLEQDMPLIQEAITNTLKPITDALNALNFDDMVSGWENLAEGIGGFTDAMSDIDVGNILFVVGMLWSIQNFLVGATLEGIGNALPILGDGLSNVINATNALVGGDIEGAIKGFAGGIAQFALGLLQIPASILDKVLGFFEDLTGLDLPDISAWLDQVNADIENWLNEQEVDVEVQPNLAISGKGGKYYLLPDEMGNMDLALEQFGLYGYSDTIDTMISDAINSMGPYEATIRNFTVSFEPDDPDRIVPEGGKVIDVQSLVEGVNYDIVITPTFENETPTVNVEEVQANIETITADPETFQQALQSGSLAEMAADLMLPPTDTATELASNMEEAADEVTIDLANAIIESGMFDADTFVTDFLQPLQTKWDEYLGEEGTISQTTATWATDTALKIGTVTAAFTTLGQTVDEKMGEATSAIVIKTPTMVLTLGLLKLAVDGLTTAFENLATAAGEALTASNWVPGGPEIDGAAADGGRIRAGETFLVGERGPELFTARQTGSIIPTEALMGARSDSRGGDTITNHNTFNVSGNLDRMLYEARRRGLRLA